MKGISQQASVSYVLNMPKTIRDDLYAWAGHVNATVARLLRVYVVLGLLIHKELYDSLDTIDDLPAKTLRYIRIGKYIEPSLLKSGGRIVVERDGNGSGPIREVLTILG